MQSRGRQSDLWLILREKLRWLLEGPRGIGKAISLALASAGARVALTYRENTDAAAEVVSSIENDGGVAMALRLDVRDRMQAEAVLAETVAQFGGLHVLVNNAGINNPTDFDQITDDDWREIMEVNLRGPFVVSQSALPHLNEAGGGSIIMIGSVSGQYGGPRTAHYAASKAGLISLAQVIARFGAATKIRCNTVAAGLIASDMAASGLSDPAVARAAASIPLGRLGETREVASAVVWLASDDSSYVHRSDDQRQWGALFLTPTILFIGGGSEIIPAVKRAIDLGCRVLVADRDPSAPGCRVADAQLLGQRLSSRGSPESCA